MKTFTGWQYLLIDVANAYGLDKMTFESRINWVNEHLQELEQLVAYAEAPVPYQKAVMALRDAQAGKPSGHLVAFDAVCSGIQIMSALTGCVAGARATGCVDPDNRADAYAEVTDTMNGLLANLGMVGVNFPRSAVKGAVMKSCYGSKRAPKDLFGEETPELQAFYDACMIVAPGAFTLLQHLLETWQPYALSHEWVLPDNFHAKIKVMETVQTRLEVDELDHATFTYVYKENVGTDFGLSNVANVIHSIDAYLLRCLVRRCNYDQALVEEVSWLIQHELMHREMGKEDQLHGPLPEALGTYLSRYYATGMVDVVVLPYLEMGCWGYLPSEYLRKLNLILHEMLRHPPFPVITIHDSFASHPNHLNVVRYWYKEILAEFAESTILNDIFTQLLGGPSIYQKMTSDLATKIRGSNYALS